MQFRSEIPINQPDFEIDFSQRILLMGSCFSSEIGNKLKDNKLNTLINPFGTQFNPIAIQQSFSRIYTRERYSSNELVRYNDLYFSWDHSQYFSHPNKETCLNTINEQIDFANDFMRTAHVFVFTLGSAIAYFLKEGGFYVSNCHKVPQKHFEKRILQEKEILTALHNLIFMVKDINPKAKIIFTVSPVRHKRDGFHINNISKSLLMVALHKTQKEFEDTYYFPSYEIVMDELRDYRFYKEDMVHPNHTAVNYVWQKFSDTFFSQETQNKIKSIAKINNALAHRPQNPKSIHHKKFLYDLMKKIELLKVDLPSNAFEQELQFLKQKIYND